MKWLSCVIILIQVDFITRQIRGICKSDNYHSNCFKQVCNFQIPVKDGLIELSMKKNTFGEVMSVCNLYYIKL